MKERKETFPGHAYSRGTRQEYRPLTLDDFFIGGVRAALMGMNVVVEHGGALVDDWAFVRLNQTTFA